MKTLKLIGACLCAVYIVFLFLTKEFNPFQWPSLAITLCVVVYLGLLYVCIIVQRGIDADQKENDKYFENHTNE